MIDIVWNSNVSKQVRRMFYLLTPTETSFEHAEDVPEYIDESVSVFLSFLITESILSFLLSDHHYRINDSITSSSAGLFSRLQGILINSFQSVTYKWVYDNFRLTELPWDSAWTWFLAFLFVDFGYYWFHRMAHEVNIIWASHQVHHSAEDYNLSTALRQSLVQTYTSWIFYLPLALAIPTSVFITHNELNLLYQFWIHTQCRCKLGPLEYILNTPTHHRVHHGRNPYCIDKNYGGVLIIWDRLFGTFQAEEKEEVVFGLTVPINTFEPLEIQFFYFKKMWHRIQNGENIFSVLFKGPSWKPGESRLGNPKDRPEIKFPIKKYDPKLPFWCNIYILLHFLTMIGLFQYLLTSKKLMSQWSVLAGLLFIVFTLSCFGRLFDKRWHAPYLEMIRCGFVFFISTMFIRPYIPKNLSYMGPCLQVFYLASLIAWIIYITGSQKENSLRIKIQ